MKKYLVVVMAVMLLCIGCGSTDTPDTEANTQQMETESSVTNQDEETSSATSETTATEITTEIETEVQTEVETETQTESEVPSEPEAPTYTYTDVDKTMYAKSSVNVRDLPSTDGNKLGGLSKAQEVHVTGQCNETSWYRIDYNGCVAYVSNSYLVNDKLVEETPAPEEPTQPSQPEECPYEMGVWYDMGWYYFKLIPTQADFVYGDLYTYGPILQERYPDHSISEGGCYTKWGNYVHIVHTYPIQGSYVFN